MCSLRELEPLPREELGAALGGISILAHVSNEKQVRKLDPCDFGL